MRPPGLGGRKALWEPWGLSLPSNSLSLRPWNFAVDPPRKRGQPVRRKQGKAISAQLLRGEAASELAGRARRHLFLLRGSSAWRREGPFLLNSCSSPSLVVRAEQEGLAGVGIEDAVTDRREISFPVLAPHDKPGLQTKTKPPFNRFRRNMPRERCLRAQSANGGDVQSRRLMGRTPQEASFGRKKSEGGVRMQTGLAGVFPTFPMFRVAAFKVLPAKAGLGFPSPPALQGTNRGVWAVAWDATWRQTGEAENGAPFFLFPAGATGSSWRAPVRASGAEAAWEGLCEQGATRTERRCAFRRTYGSAKEAKSAALLVGVQAASCSENGGSDEEYCRLACPKFDSVSQISVKFGPQIRHNLVGDGYRPLVCCLRWLQSPLEWEFELALRP